jgi:4-azaleucine resistance transporter AzlC
LSRSTFVFAPAAMKAGAIASFPLALSCGAYGVVYGVLAHAAGWSFGDLIATGLIVFAGASQFVALQMWSDPVPVAAILAMTVALNLRYMLAGASLRGVFAGSRLSDRILGMHFVADENWVVTMAAHGRGEASPAFLLGGGLMVALFWVGSGLLGQLIGGQVPDPNRLGLDFAFPAAFTVMAMALRHDRRDVAIWGATAAAAAFGDWAFGGVWYVICGALSGVAVAALCWKETGDE